MNRSDDSPSLGTLQGYCCFGIDNLERFALIAGEGAARDLLLRIRTGLDAIFGAESVRQRSAVPGFLVSLSCRDAAESVARIYQALAMIAAARGTESAASPVSGYAGLALDGGAQGGEGAGAGSEDDLCRAAQAAAAAAAAHRRPVWIHGERSMACLRSAELLCDLRQAMAEDRLKIFVQEICQTEALPDGRRNFEILVQMTDRDGVDQPAARFLPMAEDSALIESLDRWVIERVLLGYGAELRARPWISLSLNLSGRSLGQAEIWPFLQDTIQASGLVPERLRLEITETSRIGDMEQAIATVRAARAAGLSVALDDFGAGLSGFGYLMAFDVDCIKIDGKLIPGCIDSQSRETEILKSILQLAGRLGIEVVAEHVSSREIYTALAALGVTRMQGYELARPCPIEELFL